MNSSVTLYKGMYSSHDRRASKNIRRLKNDSSEISQASNEPRSITAMFCSVFLSLSIVRDHFFYFCSTVISAIL